jgi:hypothetical protein
MNFEIKVIVVIALVVVGASSGFQKLRQDRNDSRGAITEDLIDVIFSLPQLIFSTILSVVGAGWLYYLLTSD